jgi:hypothetical protein
MSHGHKAGGSAARAKREKEVVRIANASSMKARGYPIASFARNFAGTNGAMGSSFQIDSEGARSASEEQIPALLDDAREDILLALLDNPRLDENHLCLLVGRKGLSTAFLEGIANQRQWLKNYRVRRSLASIHTYRKPLACAWYARFIS